ncbi:MAG: ABC transporter ATP-binding protein [Myxococcales bacterium]|nr:ABC transporter ATP-binding protein [Myxococcales bacterium]
MSGPPALFAENLSKTFRLGFFRKRVEAVREVSFEVQQGEIFGFLGPNGAGKTTTMKMLMGLVFPDRGQARVLGRPVADREAKRRLGYLPETPYFYEYLTAEEFLDFVGRLVGLSGAKTRQRRDELLGRVGLEHARGRPLRKFSKGMLQRVGIAQALMGDPELVILDEPMTGLDPLGRKDVRDLMVSLKREGKTIFFSTHILPDVEMICDRVALVVGGRTVSQGPLTQLLSAKIVATELLLRPSVDRPLPTPPPGTDRLESGEDIRLDVPGGADVDAYLQAVLASGAHVMSVSPRRESLEAFFVREANRGMPGEEQSRQAEGRP